MKTSTSLSDNIYFYISAYEINVLLADESYELHYLYNIKGDCIKRVVFTNQQLRNEIVKKFLEPIQFEVRINKEDTNKDESK